jgi:hypothetical protein
MQPPGEIVSSRGGLTETLQSFCDSRGVSSKIDSVNVARAPQFNREFFVD